MRRPRTAIALLAAASILLAAAPGTSAATPPVLDFSLPDEGATATQFPGVTVLSWTEAPVPGRTVASRVLVPHTAVAASAAACATAAYATGAAITATGPSRTITYGAANRCYWYELAVTDSAGEMATAVSGHLWISPVTGTAAT